MNDSAAPFGSPASDILDATRTTVIRPHSRWPGLGLGELWDYRSICLVLVKRNLMVRYRQTVVGAAWTIAQPIALMLVFTVFFGLFARLPSQGLPYAVFFFLGLWPWQMVAKMLNEGANSVIANSSLVTRVYFPRIYFPLSVGLSSLTDLAFGTVALVILLAFFGIIPGVAAVAAPVFIAIAWMTGLGLAFWLSALNVTYRDVTQMLPFLTQMGFFGSPIIYSSTIIPEPYRALYFLNPMALVIDGLRWAVGNAEAPPDYGWFVALASALFVLVSGYLLFRRRSATFADHV